MKHESPDSVFHDLDAMREGVEYRFKVKIRKWSAWMRPLALREMEEVAIETNESLEGLPVSQRTPMVEHLKFAKILLEKATTTEPGKVDPSLTEHMLDRMTDDEVDFVYKQYLANKKRCSPDYEKMSDDEISALVEGLKKSPEVLIERSFLEILNVCRFLLEHSIDSPAAK